MTKFTLLIVALLSLSGCGIGLIANAAGATPGNVPALHPEQQANR